MDSCNIIFFLFKTVHFLIFRVLHYPVWLHQRPQRPGRPPRGPCFRPWAGPSAPALAGLLFAAGRLAPHAAGLACVCCRVDCAAAGRTARAAAARAWAAAAVQAAQVWPPVGMLTSPVSPIPASHVCWLARRSDVSSWCVAQSCCFLLCSSWKLGKSHPIYIVISFRGLNIHFPWQLQFTLCEYQ